MSDAAVATVVSGVITVVGMIVGFLTMWIKLQHAGAKAEEAAVKAEEVEKKIDNNTAITRAGTASAASAARVAADKAIELAKQMNGALDQRIRDIVKEHTDQLVKAFTDHSEQDDRNMKDLKQVLVDLKNRIPTK